VYFYENIRSIVKYSLRNILYDDIMFTNKQISPCYPSHFM